MTGTVSKPIDAVATARVRLALEAIQAAPDHSPELLTNEKWLKAIVATQVLLRQIMDGTAAEIPTTTHHKAAA